MQFEGRVGETFLLKERRSPTEHLYVVVCPVLPETGRLVVVNITSNPNDNTVIVEPSDHPFLFKQSYVAYSYAKEVNKRALVEAAKQGAITVLTSFDDNVVHEIQQGFLLSKTSPKKIQEIVRHYLLSTP